MGVVSIVVTCLDNFDIGFCHTCFLRELLFQIVECYFQVTIEEPANQSQCEHVTALVHRFHVHTRICQTVFHHLSDRAGNHTIGVDSHLTKIICSLEGCLLQVFRTKRVSIDDDSSSRFRIAVLGFQCCSIHGNKYITQVARCIDLTCTDMYLESRYTRQRALWSAYICWIIRECADAVTYCR